MWKPWVSGLALTFSGCPSIWRRWAWRRGRLLSTPQWTWTAWGKLIGPSRRPCWTVSTTWLSPWRVERVRQTARMRRSRWGARPDIGSFSRWDMSPWRPLLVLLPRCPIFIEVKPLKVIWRSGTRRWSLRVPGLHMTCRDLIIWQDSRLIVQHWRSGDIPPFVKWMISQEICKLFAHFCVLLG